MKVNPRTKEVTLTQVEYVELTKRQHDNIPQELVENYCEFIKEEGKNKWMEQRLKDK